MWWSSRGIFQAAKRHLLLDGYLQIKSRVFSVSFMKTVPPRGSPSQPPNNTAQNTTVWCVWLKKKAHHCPKWWDVNVICKTPDVPLTLWTNHNMSIENHIKSTNHFDDTNVLMKRIATHHHTLQESLNISKHVLRNNKMWHHRFGPKTFSLYFLVLQQTSQSSWWICTLNTLLHFIGWLLLFIFGAKRNGKIW